MPPRWMGFYPVDIKPASTGIIPNSVDDEGVGAVVEVETETIVPERTPEEGQEIVDLTEDVRGEFIASFFTSHLRGRSLRQRNELQCRLHIDRPQLIKADTEISASPISTSATLPDTQGSEVSREQVTHPDPFLPGFSRTSFLRKRVFDVETGWSTTKSLR